MIKFNSRTLYLIISVFNLFFLVCGPPFGDSCYINSIKYVPISDRNISKVMTNYIINVIKFHIISFYFRPKLVKDGFKYLYPVMYLGWGKEGKLPRAALLGGGSKF